MGRVTVHDPQYASDDRIALGLVPLRRGGLRAGEPGSQNLYEQKIDQAVKFRRLTGRILDDFVAQQRNQWRVPMFIRERQYGWEHAQQAVADVAYRLVRTHGASRWSRHVRTPSDISSSSGRPSKDRQCWSGWITTSGGQEGSAATL